MWLLPVINTDTSHTHAEEILIKSEDVSTTTPILADTCRIFFCIQENIRDTAVTQL